MKLSVLWTALFAIILAFAAPETEAATKPVSDNISKNMVWSGSILVEKPVTVAKGATLAVKPGTVVRFRKGAGLTIVGVLKAEGRKGSLVTFTSAEPSPAQGDWSGINFTDSAKGSLVKTCLIEYAATSIAVAGSSPTVKDCTIQNGVQGIVLARKSASRVRGNQIKEMKEGGIQCQMGSVPEISGNVIEHAVSYGIYSGKDAQPSIKGNTITGCGTGISLSQPVPPVEDNVLKGNKFGIFMTSAGTGFIIRGNRLQDNESGIVCQQFSSPSIEKNEISGSSKEGIVCFRAASPAITGNRIWDNDKGISCIQLCNPVIRGNEIYSNKKGVYLDLSSYARVNGNNIYDNKVQVELGNMSSDWEYKINKKPVRGVQAQSAGLVSKGRATAPQQTVKDGADIMGYVEATGNWWGDKVTAEMEQKGSDANIESFVDYYDVPTRTYEGYTGVYVQDRIKYSGWKKSKISR